MRDRLIFGTAALLLASATLAGAQDKPSQDTTSGTIDVGGRFTSTTGDEARYERYRDLRDGANVNVLFSRETPNWTFDVKARNIGYRDQNFVANFNSRRVKASFLFDQTPLNYAYDSRTPFDCTAGNCSLDPGLRGQVQGRTAIGVPQTVANLAGGSIYNSIAQQFDLQSRRDTIAGEVRISATNNFDVVLGFNTYKRSGNQPFGASFAFNNATELPIVIDNRETEISAGVEWASHQGMFRAAYEHSKFDQSIPSFSFENPQFATDFCRTGLAGQAPGTCYDPSGYSNGNGPAFGRMAQPPSNTLSTFSTMGMVKLPVHTTANASFAMGANRQDEALIPWTTNPRIANAATYAAFPGLASLPRDSADMHVNYATATFNIRSQPHKYLTLNGRYRYNSRSDFTREFDAIEYVRFDAVPEETGGPSEPFNINRNTADMNASFTAIPHSNLRVGYGEDKWEHSVRVTEGWKDKTARVSYDLVGYQYATLRAQYEHTKRDTIGFDLGALIGQGMQPAARYFDEAARTRNRTTVIADITPASSFGLSLSLSTGKDNYQDADPNQQFGLLDNKNTAFTVGVNYTPSDKVSLGADYGRETFNALQQSRNSNPAPDPTWTDPTRNWNLTNDEKVNTVSAFVNLIKLVAKTDIRVGYDYSDSDQAFVHGGPRIPALQAPTPTAPNGTFVAFPNITNKWHHATVDVRYTVSKNFGLGAAYWFEKFDVEDFATINSAGPQTLPRPELGAQTDNARIDWLGSINTGYATRPYKGQTVFVRVFYTF